MKVNKSEYSVHSVDVWDCSLSLSLSVKRVEKDASGCPVKHFEASVVWRYSIRRCAGILLSRVRLSMVTGIILGPTSLERALVFQGC